MPHDPLLAPWTGSYGGVPPFDQVEPQAFKPALTRAMALFRAELDAIATSTAPPTFDNTILGLENAGREFGRVVSLFNTYRSTMNDKPMQQLEEELAPVLAAFNDEIVQHEALFARIEAVHREASHPRPLAADEQRLLEVQRTSFARQGAALAAPDKARLQQLNGRLASLYTRFSQNELHDEETYALVLEREADLEGLPASLRTAAKLAAAGKRLDGWAIANTRSSMEPFLTFSSRRDLREQGWRMWVGRGDHAGDHDNKPVIAEILALRAERARLLGFASHAHWVIDDNMARTPEAAMALTRKVWPAAVARAREEIADMQRLVDAEHAGFPLAPWDYRYYAEKVRKARYDLDQNEVKPYLQLENLREAMFWVAGQLYGLSFALIADVPVYHPDVRVYEVLRDRDHVGLWYFDPYARDGKQSGAWMSEYRTQESFRGRIDPVVSNNSNFVKGRPGEPILISWDDAITMFHEFGHALHGLASNVRFPTLAGTNTKRDFVEFPSQLNEHWLATPEVLDRFARHVVTGQPMPAPLVDKIARARTFNKGFATVEYLAAAIYDLEVHSLGPTEAAALDPSALERRIMQELGMPPEIVMRHRPTHFGHVFSGDGYSAGYYAYLWADTLTADAAEAFVEARSFYDRATAARLHASIMSVGNSVPPDVAFKNFRGREVDTDALMRDRGFPITG